MTFSWLCALHLQTAAPPPHCELPTHLRTQPGGCHWVVCHSHHLVDLIARLTEFALIPDRLPHCHLHLGDCLLLGWDPNALQLFASHICYLSTGDRMLDPAFLAKRANDAWARALKSVRIERFAGRPDNRIKQFCNSMTGLLQPYNHMSTLEGLLHAAGHLTGDALIWYESERDHG